MDRVGPTIVGRRSTPAADAARELLARNDVPHRGVDLDRDPLAPLLETEFLSAGRLPLVAAVLLVVRARTVPRVTPAAAVRPTVTYEAGR
jgi:hypothetical protein